jgi:hypothetical protein
MVPKLVDYLNQPVLVSIPALYSDAKCRSYLLLGVEMQGLWLQNEDLVSELTSLDTQISVDARTPVFVPFSHIACVVLPAPVAKVVGVKALTQARPIPPGAPEGAASAQKRVSTPKKKSGK